jgi:hypothetical protein
MAGLPSNRSDLRPSEPRSEGFFVLAAWHTWRCAGLSSGSLPNTGGLHGDHSGPVEVRLKVLLEYEEEQAPRGVLEMTTFVFLEQGSQQQGMEGAQVAGSWEDRALVGKSVWAGQGRS